MTVTREVAEGARFRDHTDRRISTGGILGTQTTRCVPPSFGSSVTCHNAHL